MIIFGFIAFIIIGFVFMAISDSCVSSDTSGLLFVLMVISFLIALGLFVGGCVNGFVYYPKTQRNTYWRNISC